MKENKMSDQSIYLKKDNGDFNGRMSTAGKNKVPTIDIARKLHLGYPVPTTPEVDQYLAARKKYDLAHEIWKNEKEPDVIREVNRQKMLSSLEEVHSLPIETVLMGWEFYEKAREEAGITTDEFPYPHTVLTTIARSIEEGAVNPDSIEDFIPARVKEFTLPNGRTGYDLAYDDYMLGIRLKDSGYIMVGANVEWINLNVTPEQFKSYSTFSEGETEAGFGEKENSAKENERLYFGTKNLEGIRSQVAARPRLVKIRSLRFVKPLPIERDVPGDKITNEVSEIGIS